MPIAIIVHGGAGTIAPDRAEEARSGCKEAALAGWRVLQAGGNALDAVEAAVRSLEDNPNYNAGTGAVLTTAGEIELDAGIMEGSTLSVGAIAGVERIKNPISLARKVLESPHVLIVGKGAQTLAQEWGISLCSRDDLLTERQYKQWQEMVALNTARASVEDEQEGYHRREFGSIAAREDEKHGTVGAVAIDQNGVLAAATSTGGIPNKYPGRVGDSPLVGCGFYADENAAISCTGHGEDFTRLLIAKRAADFVADGKNAQDAAEAAIGVLNARAKGTGGLIVVDRLGRIGFNYNSEQMAYAYITEETDEPIAGV